MMFSAQLQKYILSVTQLRYVMEVLKFLILPIWDNKRTLQISCF